MDDLSILSIYFYDETDSTNERGLELITAGAPEYTLLVAERQTTGRGRLGRKWVTESGSSLAFSVILRPKAEEIPYLGFFSFLGALCVCLAIEEKCAAKVEVKWPNDVLIDGKKTAGVLAESSFQGEKLAGTVLGIGINLFKGSVPPSSGLRFPATYVQAHCSAIDSREKFLANVMKNLFYWRPRILDKAFIDAYRQRLAFRGRKVMLLPSGREEVKGVLKGVDDSGKLVLEMKNREEKSFVAGDLRIRIIPPQGVGYGKEKP